MKEEIKKFFKGEVEDGKETLSKYSRDASIFEVCPKIVVFPKGSEDVKNLVKWVAENKDKYADPEKNKDWKNLSITARCAGTDMSGGAIGESIIMDFTRHMNKLISFENTSPDASAQVLGFPSPSARPDRSHKHTDSARPQKKKYTFYGHEVVGARMAKKIMERLKFSKKETELVEKLVRNHMFFSDTELITLSAVRRVVVKVGRENIWSLMNVRECDRVGMKKKEAPYRLRKYFAMIEEALRDPISVSQLKIDGEIMKSELGIKPGPRMGWILNALLEEILDDPSKNTKEHLLELVKSLNMLGDAELKALGDRGKEKKEKLEEEEVERLHEKHGVRK